MSYIVLLFQDDCALPHTIRFLELAPRTISSVFGCKARACGALANWNVHGARPVWFLRHQSMPLHERSSRISASRLLVEETVIVNHSGGTIPSYWLGLPEQRPCHGSLLTVGGRHSKASRCASKATSQSPWTCDLTASMHPGFESRSLQCVSMPRIVNR